MVLLGVGMYLPYVTVHTTVFELLIALAREKGNIGFPMYLADAIGYLGYCAVMLSRSLLKQRDEAFLPFFHQLSLLILLGSLVMVGASIFLYRRRFPR